MRLLNAILNYLAIDPLDHLAMLHRCEDVSIGKSTKFAESTHVVLRYGIRRHNTHFVWDIFVDVSCMFFR